MPALGYHNLLLSVSVITTVVIILTTIVVAPADIGPLGVTLWFIALFVGLSSWLTLLLNWLAGKLGAESKSSGRLTTAWRRGLLLGGWLTVILGLSSLKQLEFKDIILSFLLIALIELYVRNRS
ncbi:MAG TPA: hypothetical protein VNA68_01645 [Candidatus Dormibacteraeota bacterium]|nr:hypothetical protein [Candidatus Dormibacteraeota bacterium]